MWVKQKKKKATILLLKFLPLVGFVFLFFCSRACVKNKQVSRAQPPSNVGGVVVNEFFHLDFSSFCYFFFFCAVFLWGKAPPRRLFNEVPERQRFLGTYARLYIFLRPARIVWIFTSSRLQFWAGWHSAIAPSWAELSQVKLSAGLKVPTARLTGGWSFTWFGVYRIYSLEAASTRWCRCCRCVAHKKSDKFQGDALPLQLGMAFCGVLLLRLVKRSC